MKLFIDGVPVEALPGESLRDIIRKLALDTEELQTRPLAARIAGEVFTLNYIPLRQSDSAPENSSVRRAMAASGGQVHLLRYSDGAGKKDDVIAKSCPDTVEINHDLGHVVSV